MNHTARKRTIVTVAFACAALFSGCSTEETVYEDDPIQESEAPDNTVAGGADGVTDLSENGPGGINEQDLDDDGVNGQIPEEAND